MAVSVNARARWLVIAGILAADAVGLRLTGLRIGGGGIATLFALVTTLLALAGFYSFPRPRPRLADFAHTAAQLLALLACAGVLSYLVTTAALPLQDAGFAAADRALGFDWLDWFRWVSAHPGLAATLHFAYGSVTPQLVFIPAFLALSGQDRQSGAFIWTLLLSVLPTIGAAARRRRFRL